MIPTDSLTICKSDAGTVDCLHRLSFLVLGRIIAVSVMDSEMSKKQIFFLFSAAYFPLKEEIKNGENTICHQMWSESLFPFEVGLASVQENFWSFAAIKNIKIKTLVKTFSPWKSLVVKHYSRWPEKLWYPHCLAWYNRQQPALTSKLTLNSSGHWILWPPEVLSLIFYDSKYASGYLEVNLSLVFPLASLNSI